MKKYTLALVLASSLVLAPQNTEANINYADRIKLRDYSIKKSYQIEPEVKTNPATNPVKYDWTMQLLKGLQKLQNIVKKDLKKPEKLEEIDVLNY